MRVPTSKTYSALCCLVHLLNRLRDQTLSDCSFLRRIGDHRREAGFVMTSTVHVGTSMLEIAMAHF
jgi:hypothetical protein